MGDTAQRGLDTADHQRHIGIGFTTALRIDQHRTIRTFAALGIRCIGIIRANLAVSRIAVDHGIHIAGRDTEIQIGLAQRLERLGRLPIRLRYDTDTKALRFQQTPDQGHAKTRVIDIGVAGHQNDVATAPAQGIHFGAAHGQDGSCTETFCPIRPVAIDVSEALHKLTILLWIRNCSKPDWAGFWQLLSDS